MAQIIIPTPLRKFTDNQNKYSSSAATVAEAISELAEEYPGLKNHLFGDNGEIRSFIKVFVGEDDIKDLENGQTNVNDSSVISIVPAIAGGKK